MRALVLSLLLVSPIIAAPVGAQRLGPEVARPRLTASADTNDAMAYLEFGMSSVVDEPERAADAFYWAARLDPSSPGALYGRKVALLVRNPRLLIQYFEGGRSARANRSQLMGIDSLQLRALHLDPLMFRMLDRTLIFTYYYNNYRNRGGTLQRREFDRELQFELASEPPATKAWVYYGAGQFDQAVLQYDDALRRARNPIALRIERARTLSLRSRDAEAVEDFRKAVDLLRERDERRGEYVVFYDSKAMLLHSMGVLYRRQDNLDSARALLGRAMEEDVSFWPAHVELGRLALQQADSVTAVAELGLASELAADEPYIHHVYGQMLSATGQHADAAAAFRKAIELEPFYAAPVLGLAEALDKSGDASAKEHYERYLALAPRRDQALRDRAAARLAALNR
jgi:tetratricopeptide (TPR) repeat protein